MPYSKQHKENSRQLILNSAIKLFSNKGFNQVSIDDLMKDAGLTRGAFYAHFKNKKVLYSEAIISGARNSQLNQQKPEGISYQEWTEELLSSYLSSSHIQQTGKDAMSPCPLAFLVTDIANQEEEVKSTYSTIYKRLNQEIKHLTHDYSHCTEKEIYAVTAMMIGGVAIARVLDDPHTTEQLLNSCKEIGIELLNQKSQNIQT